MCADETDVICGFTTVPVRGLLRRIGNQIWHWLDFPLRLDLPFRDANRVAVALVECGLLERVSGWRGQRGRSSGFQLTALGRRVTGLGRLKPISRRRADAVIAKVLARIEVINRRRDLSYRIAEAHVVGSWCWGEEEVTVVDIAARLDLRDDLVGRTKRQLARDDASARVLADWLRQEFGEVLSLLKARTPHLRVYACARSSRLGPHKQRIYPPHDPDGLPGNVIGRGTRPRRLIRTRRRPRKQTVTGCA